MKAAAISTEIKIDHFLIFFVACRARKIAEAGMHPRRRRRVDRGRSPSSEAIARVCAEAFGSRRSLLMIRSRSWCVPRMARHRTFETADCRPDVRWFFALRVVKRRPLFFYDSVVKDQVSTPEGFGADWRIANHMPPHSYIQSFLHFGTKSQAGKRSEMCVSPLFYGVEKTF